MFDVSKSLSKLYLEIYGGKTKISSLRTYKFFESTIKIWRKKQNLFPFFDMQNHTQFFLWRNEISKIVFCHRFQMIILFTPLFGILKIGKISRIILPFFNGQITLPPKKKYA